MTGKRARSHSALRASSCPHRLERRGTEGGGDCGEEPQREVAPVSPGTAPKKTRSCSVVGDVAEAARTRCGRDHQGSRGMVAQEVDRWAIWVGSGWRLAIMSAGAGRGAYGKRASAKARARQRRWLPHSKPHCTGPTSTQAGETRNALLG
jgi:hypothetical protein